MRHRISIIASVLLNVILLVFCFGREFQYQVERSLWGSEAPHWAYGSGSIQAFVDAEHGNYKMLRLTTVTTADGKYGDTGERDNGIAIWSWPTYPILGEASRAANQAFVDGYNARMKNEIAKVATQPATPPGH